MKNVLFLLIILMLNACANAPFPEFENDSSVLASDSENASYDGFEKIKKQPVKPVVVEDKKTPSKKAKKTVEKKVKVAKAPEKEEKAPKVVEKPKKEAEKSLSEVKEVVNPQPEEEYKPSIEVLKEIFYFRDGSSALEGYNKEIKAIAKFVKENNAKVKILGHASSRTANADPITHKMANFTASLKRAQSVANALEKSGVKKDVIIVEALSDSRPAYLEVMPEGERLNRRAEIYLIY
ncbi:MAG: OmpA family protein [Alphaproteobacteria bacterium]